MALILAVTSLATYFLPSEAIPIVGNSPTWWLWPNINVTDVPNTPDWTKYPRPHLYPDVYLRPPPPPSNYPPPIHFGPSHQRPPFYPGYGVHKPQQGYPGGPFYWYPYPPPVTSSSTAPSTTTTSTASTTSTTTSTTTPTTTSTSTSTTTPTTTSTSTTTTTPTTTSTSTSTTTPTTTSTSTTTTTPTTTSTSTTTTTPTTTSTSTTTTTPTTTSTPTTTTTPTTTSTSTTTTTPTTTRTSTTTTTPTTTTPTTTSTSTTTTTPTTTSTTTRTTPTTSSSTTTATTSTSTSTTTSSSGICSCVPFYQCRESDVLSDGTIMFPSHGVVNGDYIPNCNYVVEVCCRTPLTTTSSTTTSSSTSSSGSSSAPCGFAAPARTVWVNGIIQPRIVGPGDGSAATSFGESPWMAAVLEDVGNPFYLGFVCGGTLVNAGVVLTAAHCVSGKAAVNLRVRLGEWNWQTQLDGPAPPQQINVNRIIIHPQYSSLSDITNGINLNSSLGNSYRNDVALLFLSQNASLNSYVSVICLPNGIQNATPYDPLSCIATGWGISKPWFQDMSSTLRKVQVAVLGNSSCQQALNFSLDNSSLCAGGQKFRDTCLGDGGGPLYCRMTNETAGVIRYILVGVTSWGVSTCGSYAIPGVYANVTALAIWINQTIQNVTRSMNVTTPSSTISNANIHPFFQQNFPHYNNQFDFSYG